MPPSPNLLSHSNTLPPLSGGRPRKCIPRRHFRGNGLCATFTLQWACTGTMVPRQGPVFRAALCCHGKRCVGKGQSEQPVHRCMRACVHACGWVGAHISCVCMCACVRVFVCACAHVCVHAHTSYELCSLVSKQWWKRLRVLSVFPCRHVASGEPSPCLAGRPQK